MGNSNRISGANFTGTSWNRDLVFRVAQAMAEEVKLKNKNVLIVPISFCVDNSETEFELEIEYKNIAKEIGIKKYILAKSPNSSSYFIDALIDMTQ